MSKKIYYASEMLRDARPRKASPEHEGRPSGSGTTSTGLGGGIIITPEMKASLPVLRLSQLDSFGASAEDIANAAIRTESAMAVVISDDDRSLVVGILHQFSDSMRHVLTQSLTTHLVPPTGDKASLSDSLSHDHNRVLVLERSIGWKMGPLLTNCLGLPINVRNEAEARQWLADYLGITYPYRFDLGGYYVKKQWTPWRCLEDEKIRLTRDILRRLDTLEDLHLLT